MGTALNALSIRKRLGRKDWGAPVEFGPDGWRWWHTSGDGQAIVSVSDLPDDPRQWIHASISFKRHTPSYEDLTLLHEAVFEDRYAYQVFAPPSEHVNIHPNALHLWGLLSGERPLPNFGILGRI